MPDQQVRVPPGPVDVGDERVQPEDPGHPLVARVAGRAVVPEGAWEEVDGQVQAGAAEEEFLDLEVGLGLADRWVEPHQLELRHPQAERAEQLTDDDLGDQRLRALAGAVELEHVGAEIVALDNGRERAALAQRQDVAGRSDSRQAHAAEPSRHRFVTGYPPRVRHPKFGVEEELLLICTTGHPLPRSKAVVADVAGLDIALELTRAMW